MSTATITRKGQITIPAAVRKVLRVEVGDRVQFVETAPGRVEMMAATKSVTALKGLFGPPRQAVSVADMNRAIAQRGAAAAKTRSVSTRMCCCATSCRTMRASRPRPRG